MGTRKSRRGRRIARSLALLIALGVVGPRGWVAASGVQAREAADDGRPPRIAVLHVAPQAGFHYRVLSSLLLREPRLVTRCFLLAASTGFTQRSSPGVPPLRRLPASAAELDRFDVIVLEGALEPPGGAGHADVFRRAFREQLPGFVRRGGGLIAVAGPGAPEPDEGLAAVLPVALHGAHRATGRVAPVCDVAGRLCPSSRVYPALPLGGLAGLRARSGATVHAHLLPEGAGAERPSPLIVTRAVGCGRTVFVASDETWRWRRAGDAHERFWRAAIDWADGRR